MKPIKELGLDTKTLTRLRRDAVDNARKAREEIKISRAQRSGEKSKKKKSA